MRWLLCLALGLYCVGCGESPEAAARRIAEKMCACGNPATFADLNPEQQQAYTACQTAVLDEKARYEATLDSAAYQAFQKAGEAAARECFQ